MAGAPIDSTSWVSPSPPTNLTFILAGTAAKDLVTKPEQISHLKGLIRHQHSHMLITRSGRNIVSLGAGGLYSVFIGASHGRSDLYFTGFNHSLLSRGASPVCLTSSHMPHAHHHHHHHHTELDRILIDIEDHVHHAAR